MGGYGREILNSLSGILFLLMLQVHITHIVAPPLPLPPKHPSYKKTPKEGRLVSSSDFKFERTCRNARHVFGCLPKCPAAPPGSSPSDKPTLIFNTTLIVNKPTPIVNTVPTHIIKLYSFNSLTSSLDTAHFLRSRSVYTIVAHLRMASWGAS